MLMMNVLSKLVRMNNAWPITQLAWSARLGMETSFMETDIWTHGAGLNPSSLKKHLQAGPLVVFCKHQLQML